MANTAARYSNAFTNSRASTARGYLTERGARCGAALTLCTTYVHVALIALLFILADLISVLVEKKCSFYSTVGAAR